MHTQRRRLLLHTVPAAVAALGTPWRAWAQAPQEAARIVVGYPPGGSVDVVTRTLAERLKTRQSRALVIDNKAGAAGRLAIEVLKGAAPDGATMLITPASVLTMYPHIYKNLSYDVFTDLAPVSIVAMTGFVLAVGPMVAASVRTLDDFIAWCKANPPSAQCANPGAGSLPHFMAMLLAEDTRVALGHVPFRGGLLAMQAVAGGQVAAAIATEASALALAQAGKLRVLAISHVERSRHLPNAPTFRELGYPRLSQREWFGAFMPGRTPASAIAPVADGIAAALREPEVREVWHKLALAPESSTPAELQRALRTEHDFWGPIIKASGFTPEA